MRNGGTLTQSRKLSGLIIVKVLLFCNSDDSNTLEMIVSG